MAQGSDAFHAANLRQLAEFRDLFRERILLIGSAFDLFAEHKAHLRRTGRIIDNFDLLIGCTALAHDLTLVTRNIRHFVNLPGLHLENWVDG